MDGNEFPLYGRDRATGLVREFLVRPESNGRPVTRPTPVIVFTGSARSGKSALLANLAERGKGHIPASLVDCADFESGRARHLLALLAFELNSTSGRYGTVPFPRLITGLIALQVPLDDVPLTGDRDIARELMRKALEDRKNTASLLRETVQEALNAGVSALGAQPAWLTAALDLFSKAGPRLVLGGLVSTRYGRQVVLGKGQDWYGSHDPDEGQDAIDALIELNRNAARTAPKGAVPEGVAAKDALAARREAADLLWDAFLADLADAFDRRRADNWSYNCLVLLDSAEAGAGPLFLDELVKARKRRQRDGLVPDPLTVVVASQGPLLKRAAPRATAAPLAEAGYDDFARRAAGHPDGPWWYPVELAELSAADVAGMAREFNVSHGTRRAEVASAVYRYTQGHAGTSRALLAAMGESGETDLASILEYRARTGGSTPLADRLLDDLMSGVSPRVKENLVTCSAARDQEAALKLGSFPGLLNGQAWDDEIRNPAFWNQDQELHPQLRRLLLRRLAARPDGAQDGWLAVHDRLRRLGAAEGDPTGELYHALACGDIAGVSEWLNDARATMRAQAWLAMIDAVAAAPNNLATGQRDEDYVGELVGQFEGDAKRLAPVAQLVTASWIDGDPLSQPGRGGLRVLAKDAMKQIARAATRDKSVLLARADAEYLEDLPAEVAPAAPTREGAFDPPRSTAGQARGRRRRLAAAALAVVIAAGGAVFGYEAASAPANCGATVTPFQLTTVQGECVGVTDATTGYYFDPSDKEAVHLQQLIGALNRQAEASPAYLTIGYVETLTLPPPGPTGSAAPDVSSARIDDLLQGAYLALKAADSADSPLAGVKIRLVLANVGSAEQGYSTVASQLTSLASRSGRGRLITVAGMGISTQDTQTLAQDLGDSDIPMFGAVTTADSLDHAADSYLERAVPSVAQQLQVLVPFLKRPGEPLAAVNGAAPQVSVVEDTDPDDLYKQSLDDDFSLPNAVGQVSPDARYQYSYTPGGLSPNGEFYGITLALCQSSRPSVVLYEGRESVLVQLIQQLNENQGCHGDQISIITGSDANALPPNLTHDTLGGAIVTVYYSDIEPQTVTPQFQGQYQAAFGSTPPTPWMLASYDSVTAAWNLIKLTLNPGGGANVEAPTAAAISPSDAADYLNDLTIKQTAVEGATGPLVFSGNGDLAQPNIPVVEIANGKTPQVINDQPPKQTKKTTP
jgi:hypothetical protein